MVLYSTLALPFSWKTPPIFICRLQQQPIPQMHKSTTHNPISRWEKRWFFQFHFLIELTVPLRSSFHVAPEHDHFGKTVPMFKCRLTKQNTSRMHNQQSIKVRNKMSLFLLNCNFYETNNTFQNIKQTISKFSHLLPHLQWIHWVHGCNCCEICSSLSYE